MMMPERTQYMFDRICQELRKTLTRNIIVFCGLAHVINGWHPEGGAYRYDRGLLSLKYFEIISLYAYE